MIFDVPDLLGHTPVFILANMASHDASCVPVAGSLIHRSSRITASARPSRGIVSKQTRGAAIHIAQFRTKTDDVQAT
jgi:hypothetical protein